MRQKYTIDTYTQQYHISRASALNKLSKLKKQGFATVSGGGYQKRIYTVNNTKIVKKKRF